MWVIVLVKVNKLPCFAACCLSGCDSGFCMDLSWASSGQQVDRIIDLKGEVRTRLAAFRQTHKKPPWPGVNP